VALCTHLQYRNYICCCRRARKAARARPASFVHHVLRPAPQLRTGLHASARPVLDNGIIYHLQGMELAFLIAQYLAEEREEVGFLCWLLIIL
jgi:hypothetical protein